MKKMALLLVLCLMCSFISGCTTEKMVNNPLIEHHLKKLRNSTDEYVAKQYGEEFARCFKSEDKNGLIELFSQTALDNCDSLDSDLEELFALFRGRYDDITYDAESLHVEETNKHGQVVTLIEMQVCLSDEDNNYKLLLVIKSVDMFDSNNIGLQSIQHIKDINSGSKYKSNGLGVLIL